jgi:hypothetical protein
MHPARVQEVFVESANGERYREGPNPEEARVRTDQPLGDHGDEIRVGDEVERLEVVGDGQGDVPAPAFLPEPGIDRVLPVLSSHDRHVPRLEEERGGQGSPQKAMAAAYGARIPIREEPLLVEAFVGSGQARDDDIQAAPGFEGIARALAPGLELETDPRRVASKLLEERGQEKIACVVRDGKAESARALPRLERLGDEQVADPGESVLDGLPKGLRTGGELHPRARADEQGVAQQGPKPLEGVAHRGLGTRDALGRFSDARRRQEGVEGHQEIQIDGGEIHWVHDLDKVHRFRE